MGIVNAFDPSGGANGGFVPGAGGAASLRNLPFETIDLTDGSWTLLDPDSFVDTVTFSGGFNTITYNGVSATTDHQWSAGTTQRAPRWYKNLEVGGIATTTSDYTWTCVRFEPDQTVTDIFQQNVVGVALDAASTDANIMDLTGGVYQKNGTFTTAYGVITLNTFTTVGDPQTVYTIASMLRCKDALGAAQYMQFNSSNLVEQAGSRNSNIKTSGAAFPTNQQIIVGAGVGGAQTITAGDQVRFKAGYFALTFDGA